MSSESGGPRSVRIGDDERGAWSSDRPRGKGDVKGPRPRDISTRCRTLRPTDSMRYSPGSLLLVASASADLRRAFVQRLITDNSSLLSLDKVRELIRGRVGDDELDERAGELLVAAVKKRLAAGDTVVVPLETLGAEERAEFVRPAAESRRPRHIIFLDAPRDQVAEEDAGAVSELRQAVDGGTLGEEGIQTAMRLGGASITELKRIVFRPPPKDD